MQRPKVHRRINNDRDEHEELPVTLLCGGHWGKLEYKAQKKIETKIKK